MPWAGLPPDYASRSCELRALKQLERHLYRIQRSAGYNYDVVDVFPDRHDFENAGGNFPVCNLVMGVDEVLNASDIDRSLNVEVHRAVVHLDWILSDAEPSVARGKLKADLLKYFGQDYNYMLPENDDGSAPSCFNFMFSSFTPYGDDQQKPTCTLQMEAFLWWRTTLGNPYQLN